MESSANSNLKFVSGAVFDYRTIILTEHFDFGETEDTCSVQLYFDISDVVNDGNVGKVKKLFTVSAFSRIGSENGTFFTQQHNTEIAESFHAAVNAIEQFDKYDDRIDAEVDLPPRIRFALRVGDRTPRVDAFRVSVRGFGRDGVAGVGVG